MKYWKANMFAQRDAASRWASAILLSATSSMSGCFIANDAETTNDSVGDDSQESSDSPADAGTDTDSEGDTDSSGQPSDGVHLTFDVSGFLPSGSGYVPVVPARVLDTRLADQEFVGPLTTDQTISVTIAGKAGLPAAAQLGAVVLNVTIVGPQGTGYLSVYPDPPVPDTSNINFVEGETTPVLAIVRPGDDGKVELLHVTDNGASHVLVDAFGYFPPSADVHMVPPERVFDSREPEFGDAMVSAGTREIRLAGVGGIPASGVGAVVASLAVVKPVEDGYATIYPTGTPQPATSNLDYAAGAGRANLVIVPVSEDGFATLFTLEDAHYLVDVLGWFGEGADFEPISPLRLLDTNADESGPIGNEESITIDVVGASIPADVGAIFGNLTAVQPTMRGFAQVYPETVPFASNLNFVAGPSVSNAVLAEVSSDGKVRVQVVLPP